MGYIGGSFEIWRKDEKFVFMHPCIRFRGCTRPLSVLHRGWRAYQVPEYPRKILKPPFEPD